MSNEFDIEKARAGEPVEFEVSEGIWIPTHFIGVSAEGYMVIQHQILGLISMTPTFCCKPSDLRMAPKKIKVRWRVALIGSELTLIANDEDHARVLERGEWGQFKQWLTGWQEAEIEP